MANSIASLKLVLSYPGPGGGTVAPPSMTVLAPFQASSAGEIDVPDAATSATAFSIPFGSVGTRATLVIISNDTGQLMTVKVNGSAALHDLPDGGWFVHGQDATAGSAPLTAVSLTTTATQSGAGKITYFVFGDPTA